MKHWYEFRAAAAGETEILLYDEIGGFGVSASQFITDLAAVPKNNRLILRIHSPGGSVLDGNAIFNAIKAHPGGVTTQIDGLAASMAGVLAIAGTPARMASNGLFMLHNVSGGAYGNAEDMRRTASLLDKVQETVLSAYVAKTRKSAFELQQMMDEETWLNATEAKAHGFIDEITNEQKMAASFDLSKFRKPPTQIDNSPTNKMTIETPEFLALQAEHKTTCELATTLKTDLEAKTAEVTSLSAQLSEANTKLENAQNATAEIKASMEKAAAEHAAALSDFDKKVADKAAMTLAASGTQPVVLGSSSNTESDAELYDTFKKADPITSKMMLEDPAKGPRIRLESQRRHK